MHHDTWLIVIMAEPSHIFIEDNELYSYLDATSPTEIYYFDQQM